MVWNAIGNPLRFPKFQLVVVVVVVLLRLLLRLLRLLLLHQLLISANV
jgi:hypothetical protein